MIPEPDTMRDTFFLIIIASGLLVIHLAVLPVSAAVNGSQGQAVAPAIVTISTSPSAEGSYIFGDDITFSGINTGSETTYLFITGPSLNAAGSQIESNDSRIAPVTDGVRSTFKAVRVGTDNHWLWTWDTHKIPLNTGKYTIFAVNSPHDKTHLGGAIYDSVAINITGLELSASVRPPVARQGETITISGKATGHPGPGIAIWVIGPVYSNRFVVEPDSAGSYSLDIDSTTTHLLPGNYHVFVEHPSTNDAFDFDLNGDYLFNNEIRSNIFTFQGNGRLYGEAAHTAFSAAVNGPKTDDLIMPVSFSLGIPPATTVVATSGYPSNATYSPGDGITLSGNTTLPGNTTGPAVVSSFAPRTPAETVTEVPGNSSGNFPLPAGNDGGDLPYWTLAGVFFIILIGGIGGAAFLFMREKSRSVPEKSFGNSLILPQRDEVQDPGAGTRTPATVTALPVTIAAGDPASPAQPMNAFPKELADKYTQVSPIGSGGFAMVYSAYRVSDDQKVAVKIPIRSNERTGKSFLHEIKVWESMHHPNIVEVTATNILPVPYVEMEFVPVSLENMAKPVPVVVAARIIHGITQGIRYAHERRCIHRDIKPQNILLTHEMVPKITDWGISKVLEENNKKTTVAGFSLAYAAPEQIAPEKFGSTDERTDIFQIGAVFYELVTGMTPFDDESMMEMVSQITTEDPILPSDIDPDTAGVERIILTCLAKNKNERYQSAEELLDTLTEYLDMTGWGLFEDEA
jgi:hypothetical protein